MNQSLLNLPDIRLATVDKVEWPELASFGISMDVLRLDRIHPVISGNKWFKIQPYLQNADGPLASPSALISDGSFASDNHLPFTGRLSPDNRLTANGSSAPLLTFGGAWSNHIIAAAYAAKQANIPITGIIRGERPPLLSYTLQAAIEYGMQLEFISRQQYREKDSPAFLEQLSDRYPGARIIPEGGAGVEGIQGSEKILPLTNSGRYSHILCAIGTGAMYRGIARSASPNQTVLGIPVLKGLTNLSDLRREGLPDPSAADPVPPDPTPFRRLIAGYHFGGYARKTTELLDFMNRFYQVTGIPTDFVYTGKLFFAALDLVRKELFPAGSRLLVIHSGGLQGNRSLPEGILAF